MNRKIVITEFNSKRYLLDFTDEVCTRISVLGSDDTNIVGNIYIGRVENVVKNINAAFVEIQKGVKCYYSLQENQNHIFLNQKNNSAVNIGDKLLIQVSREAVKTKPATATCKLEIHGKYVVVSADVKGVLVSSKIKKNPQALIIKEALIELLDSCQNFGFILRTNAAEAELNDVVKEAKQLSDTFAGIIKASQYGMFFDRLYSSMADYCNEINNVPTNELEKIITDQKDVYNTILQSVSGLDREKVVFYEDEMLSLNKLYSLETLLKRSTDRKVWLKSGGYIVIDQTEAMTVIDVNSGKQIAGKTKANKIEQMEDSFFKVNMEAANELARQLSVRNLSGIIIVDFINMKNDEHNKELLSFLSKCLKQDSVTASVIDITKLGLVEITRKRNGKSLAEQLQGEIK